MKTNFYIDAFNLFYGSLKGKPDRKWLDPAALFGAIFPDNEIHRIRYFTARVENRPPDFRQPERQAAYFRALETIPDLSIHYGQYRTRPTYMTLAAPPRRGPKSVRVLKTEEKGSDVNLASNLLLDAFRKDCEVAIVVSNDADLKSRLSWRSASLASTSASSTPTRGRDAVAT